MHVVVATPPLRAVRPSRRSAGDFGSRPMSASPVVPELTDLGLKNLPRCNAGEQRDGSDVLDDQYRPHRGVGEGEARRLGPEGVGHGRAGPP